MTSELLAGLARTIVAVLFSGIVISLVVFVITRALLLARIRKADDVLFDRLRRWGAVDSDGKASFLRFSTSFDRFIEDEGYLELSDRRAREIGVICARSTAVLKWLIVLMMVAFIGLSILSR
jgi:hypothetical protein